MVGRNADEGKSLSSQNRKHFQMGNVHFWQRVLMHLKADRVGQSVSVRGLMLGPSTSSCSFGF